MAQKVLLISINTYAFPYPVFPLGIVHLASALNRAGYDAELYDMQADREDLATVINRYSPDVIGLSMRNIDNVDCLKTNYFAPELTTMTETIRSLSSAPIVLGGSGYSLFPERLLQLTGADFGVWGEGDSALPELLDCLAARKPYDHIPGLVFRKDNHITTNPKGAVPIALVPSVKRPGHLTTYYIRHSTMLNIQTQRGCGFRCCYCTYPLIDGRTFRFRSPTVVCDEIEDAIQAGARYFFIVDSVFNTTTEHVTGICEEIIRRKQKIAWGCFLRPKGLTQPLMNLMAQAGLSHVEFGTDSLCDSVLDAYLKDFTVADVVQSSEYAHNAGVKYAHFLIIGGPTETEKTIQESFANAARIKKSVFFPYIGMRLYPDTPLYNFALSEGSVTREKDLLSPFFYMTPHVSQERMAALLQEYCARRKNWIVGDINEPLKDVMQKLRTIGVVGPLWEFLAQ